MSRLECLGNLKRDSKRFTDWYPSLVDPVGQCLTVNIFQNQGETTSSFLDAINCRNVRMIERRQQLRLASKPSHPVAVFSQGFRKDLDRDVSAELHVPRAIDFSHSACTK